MSVLTMQTLTAMTEEEQVEVFWERMGVDKTNWDKEREAIFADTLYSDEETEESKLLLKEIESIDGIEFKPISVEPTKHKRFLVVAQVVDKDHVLKAGISLSTVVVGGLDKVGKNLGTTNVISVTRFADSDMCNVVMKMQVAHRSTAIHLRRCTGGRKKFHTGLRYAFCAETKTIYIKKSL